MTVPLFDTTTPLAPLRAQIADRVTEVIRRGAFILGPEVRAFEQELAAYLGARHAVGVANGTDALTIAARAAGVQPGDDVIVPSFTFYATAEAIASLGARPVFADVDRGTRNLTAETVQAARTPKTTAVVTVDLFGLPAPSEEIKRATGLAVIEDAAQAIGSRTASGRAAGTLGDVGTFSFYPSKNLGAFGDGGAIVTDDDEIAATARALRFHGSRDKQTFALVGYNSRLDEIQAAILRVLLPHLDTWAAGRHAAGEHYAAAGLGEHVTLPANPDNASVAWHLYVVAHPDADAILTRLNDSGVQARAYYRVPLHRQPAMAPYLADADADADADSPAPHLPVTDELSAQIIALPMSPVLDRRQADEVLAALAAVPSATGA